MSPAMSSEKNTVSPMRNPYRLSTRVAMVDAASGKRGGMSARAAGLPPFRPDHDCDESDEAEDGRSAGHTNRAHDGESVSPGHRIVVVAVEEERVDDVAHASG